MYHRIKMIICFLFFGYALEKLIESIVEGSVLRAIYYIIGVFFFGVIGCASAHAVKLEEDTE